VAAHSGRRIARLDGGVVYVEDDGRVGAKDWQSRVGGQVVNCRGFFFPFLVNSQDIEITAGTLICTFSLFMFAFYSTLNFHSRKVS
jgi:hypothetical protein